MKETRIARNTLALLLLAIAAMAVNVAYAKKAQKKHKPRKLPNVMMVMSEDNETCWELMRIIKKTPDFFEKAHKKGYAYIMLESPFKREKISDIPPNYFLAAANVTDALSDVERIYSYMNIANMGDSIKCDGSALLLSTCEDKIGRITYSFRYPPYYRYQRWLEASAKDGFFYSTPTHFLRKPSTERMMGFAGAYNTGIYELKSIIGSISYLFDEKGIAVDGLLPGLSNIDRYSWGSSPIDFRGKSYEISILLGKKPNDDYVKKWGRNISINTVELLDRSKASAASKSIFCKIDFFNHKR